MAKTVGRLKQGDLLIPGNIDERLPAVANGLIAYFPFDGTDAGKGFSNLLNTSDWKVGTSGSQGMFGQNGTTDENQILLFQNPWGGIEPTWATISNNVESDSDGGWNVTGRPIDHTKKYRLTVWIRRENVGDGRTYFGCQGSSVSNLGSTTANTNPYFTSKLIGEAPEMENEWTLWVGYIHPSDYAGGTDPTNGIYTLDGKRTRGFTDYKWMAGQTTGGHRTYLYYSTSIAERQYWVRPRMEMCDGTEPTIQELLRGEDNKYHITLNSNLTIKNDGIAVDEPTTNLSPRDGSFDSSSGEHVGDVALSNGNHTQLSGGWQAATHYNDGVCRIVNTMTPYGPGKAVRWIHNKVVGWKGVTSTVSWTAEAGKTYTISIYVRVNGHANPSAYAFYGDATHRFHFIWEKTPNSYKNEWIKGTLTFTPTVTHSGGVYLYGDSDGKEGSTIDYFGYQIEEKKFATSFTKSSRAANSQLRIPVNRNLDTDPTTFVFKIKPTSDVQKLVDASNAETTHSYKYTAVMDFKTSTGGRFDMWWDRGGKTLSLLSGDGVGGGWIYAGSSMAKSSDEIYGAVVCSGLSTKLYVIQNGVLTSSERVRTGGVGIASAVALDGYGNGYLGSHIISDFSIYNRALSEEEIFKFYKKTFSISKDGEALSKVREMSNGTPKTALYLPLGVDGETMNGSLKPVTETNTVYENGAVWIGTGTTNMFNSQLDFTVSGTGTTGYYYPPSKEWVLTLAAGDTGSWRGMSYNRSDAVATPGSTHTISWEVYSDDVVPIYIDLNNFGVTTSTGSNDNDINRSIKAGNTEPGKWIKMSATYSFDAALTQNFYMQNKIVFANGFTPTKDTTIKIRNLQQEQTLYPTAFIEGSTGQTYLHYPYDTINLSQDFTVMGWFNPSTVVDGTYNPAITYNRRSSNYTNRRILIMNNSGSANILQGWISSGTSETLIQAPSSPGMQTDKWNFFALVKTASTVKLWHGVNGSIGYGSNSTAAGYLNTFWNGTTDATTGTVTTYIDSNWGWMIGEYHTGGSNSANGYFRDYSFTQSALSDDDIGAIYKTQLRAYKDNRIQVQGQIKEGKVL
jgi:hypothetical protein